MLGWCHAMISPLSIYRLRGHHDVIYKSIFSLSLQNLRDNTFVPCDNGFSLLCRTADVWVTWKSERLLLLHLSVNIRYIEEKQPPLAAPPSFMVYMWDMKNVQVSSDTLSRVNNEDLNSSYSSCFSSCPHVYSIWVNKGERPSCSVNANRMYLCFFVLAWICSLNPNYLLLSSLLLRSPSSSSRCCRGE